jgi:cell shape-determining protein MreC
VWNDFMAKWGEEIKKKNPNLDEKKLQGKINLKWAAYLGDLRKKLLKELWDFIDSHMTPGDYEALKEEFFSETTPQAVRGLEKEKAQKQVDYQRGRDYRTILKARKDKKEGDTRIQNLVEKLEKELKKEGKSLEDELAKEEKKGNSGSDEPEGQSQISSIAASISTRIVRPWS